MDPLDRDAALALAARICAASRADETEVTVDAVEERFVRFADRGPTQCADRHREVLSVRARLRGEAGWREGRATADGLGEAQVRGALERALDLARVAPPAEELGPLEGPYAGMESVGAIAVDGPTREHGFEAKAAWISQALAACAAAGVVPAGLASTGTHARTLVTSAGRAVHDARTRASFQLTASAPDLVDGAGLAEWIGRRVEDLDVGSVIRTAVDKAARSQGARAVPPGEYDVVLEPAAASALLLFAGYQGLGAQEVAEESSFLCGRVGERLFPEELTLVDDASNALHPGVPFDGEGTRRERVELLSGGALRGPVTDSLWARRLGVANTGHALPQPSTSGPKPANLCVAPGASSLEELIGGMERGLVVTEFHYTNLIDPREMSLTGMTRNGTFLVEDGEVVGAVRNLRFTESLVRALSRVTGVGRDVEVAGALFSGEIVTPALRVEGFRFTSTSDF
jgi:PmbA protein